LRVTGALVHERVVPGVRPEWIFFNGVPVSGSIWEPLVTELQSRIQNTLVVVDLPGTGGSRLAGDNTTWSLQRAAVREYLANRGEFVLLVHDIAGPIVLPLLSGEARAEGVVLFNTILRPSRFEPLFLMRILQIPWLGWVAAAAIPCSIYSVLLRRLGLERPGRVPRALLVKIHAETLGQGRWRQLHAAMRGFELDERTDDAIQHGLASVPRRPLVIWGDADPSLGAQLSHLEGMSVTFDHRHLPRGRHFAMLDHPSEIAAWLAAWSLEGLQADSYGTGVHRTAGKASREGGQIAPGFDDSGGRHTN
jgi:pimeloyl-ACP methyl ester carboxylesterase